MHLNYSNSLHYFPQTKLEISYNKVILFTLICSYHLPPDVVHVRLFGYSVTTKTVVVKKMIHIL